MTFKYRLLPIIIWAIALSAAQAEPTTNAARPDEEVFLEGCIEGGDDEGICLCALNGLRSRYIPTEFKLTLAMMVTGMTGDQKRAQELSALFGGDMQAFGNFAKDARLTLDSIFIECRKNDNE